MPDAYDVQVVDHGSVVTFQALTDVARSWMDEHVVSEPWQWLGSALAVDHRLAGQLIEGMYEAGLLITLS